MDIAQIGSVIASVLGGGVLLKLLQTWLAHRRAIEGEFSSRNSEARENFRLVVQALENRIQHLEDSEDRCQLKNAELERKILVLESCIEDLMKRRSR